MSSLDNMANRSNEKREQRIMILRRMFEMKKVITLGAAAKALNLTSKTVRQYCIDGDIPLIDGQTGVSIVPLTASNRPTWLR